MKLEKRLTKVENEQKLMKEEATNKEEAKKEEVRKKRKETTKDMVARWNNDENGCSKDELV
jgi:hypothetical protein